MFFFLFCLFFLLFFFFPIFVFPLFLLCCSYLGRLCCLIFVFHMSKLLCFTEVINFCRISILYSFCISILYSFCIIFIFIHIILTVIIFIFSQLSLIIRLWNWIYLLLLLSINSIISLTFFILIIDTFFRIISWVLNNFLWNLFYLNLLKLLFWLLGFLLSFIDFYFIYLVVLWLTIIDFSCRIFIIWGIYISLIVVLILFVQRIYFSIGFTLFPPFILTMILNPISTIIVLYTTIKLIIPSFLVNLCRIYTLTHGLSFVLLCRTSFSDSIPFIF